MRRSRQPWSKLPRAALLLTVFGLSLMAPVTQSAPAQKRPLPAPATQESKDENIEAVRSELLQLLRLSPKLSLAISADPTLLADEAYVSRNNPELAEFLHNHAEVVRNPEFYLFFPNKFPAKGGRPTFTGGPRARCGATLSMFLASRLSRTTCCRKAICVSSVRRG